jgi:cytidylate kinase
MAIVTISRGTKSGGEALAKRVAEKLGVPAISREILQEAAAQFGVSEAIVSQQLEKTKGIIYGPSSERYLYLTVIQLTLAERASKGPFVYYGHAGHLLLKGIPQVLKVRVITPLIRRAQKMMETQKISLEEAKKAIEKMDESRIKWTRFLYNVDWQDPALYDLVFNLDYLGIETASEMIVCALDQPEFKESPDSQNILKDFFLASKVKAALATSEKTKGLVLEVTAKECDVSIKGSFETTGIFHSGKQRIKNDLIEIAQKQPNVKKVLVEIEDISVVLE